MSGKQNQIVLEMKSWSLENANVNIIIQDCNTIYGFYIVYLKEKSWRYVTFACGLILSKHLVCLNRWRTAIRKMLTLVVSDAQKFFKWAAFPYINYISERRIEICNNLNYSPYRCIVWYKRPIKKGKPQLLG